MTPLGAALRKRFASPEAVLQALGLDAAFVATGRAGSDVVVGDSAAPPPPRATGPRLKAHPGRCRVGDACRRAGV